MTTESVSNRASELFGLRLQKGASRQHRWLKTPAITLFVMMATADLVFIGLHVLWANDLVGHVFYAITKDRGYAEVYQYIKEFWIVLLLLVAFGRRRYFGYLVWSGLFVYILLDDSLRLHERLGGSLVEMLAIAPQFGLRGQDIGEAAVSLAVLTLFAPLMVLSYVRGATYFKQICRVLVVLVAALAAFGVGVDMLHSMLESQAFIATVLAVVEDGGEMIIVSLIVSYCYGLIVDSAEERSAAVQQSRQ